MAKYYVQSGSMRSIVQAESTQKAALWAVHQAMKQVLPLDDANGSSGLNCDQSEAPQEVAVLSGKVTVSEQGFDGVRSTTMRTMEVVAQWNQMVATLDRLEQMLYRAA